MLSLRSGMALFALLLAPALAGAMSTALPPARAPVADVARDARALFRADVELCGGDAHASAGCWEAYSSNGACGWGGGDYLPDASWQASLLEKVTPLPSQS